MTETIQDRNREIRSMYLKLKSKNKWTNDRMAAMLQRIYRKWNIAESTIKDIVKRKDR